MANDFDDEIMRILKRDPIDEVEKGQHLVRDPDLDPPPLHPDGLDDVDEVEFKYYNAPPQEILGHAAKVNALKKAAMLVTGDTTFSDTLERYLGIAKDIGFKVVMELPFTDKQEYDEKARDEKFFILWRDGILLAFDTFMTNKVNGGHFYYNWQPKQDADHGVTSSGHPVGKWPNHIWVGDHDCREGLRFHIRQLEKNGKFLAQWVERPFLWLLHHGDHSNKKEYNYKAINELRISVLPSNVKKAITPVPHREVK